MPTVMLAVWTAARSRCIGSGEADRMDFEGEGHYRLYRRRPTAPASAEPRLVHRGRRDRARLQPRGRRGRSSAKVVFKDMPIFYWPWLSVSRSTTSASRASCRRPIGSSTTSGLELTVPWYWNIAPNMDATIAPRLMTRRGVQLNSRVPLPRPRPTTASRASSTCPTTS